MGLTIALNLIALKVLSRQVITIISGFPHNKAFIFFIIYTTVLMLTVRNIKSILVLLSIYLIVVMGILYHIGD